MYILGSSALEQLFVSSNENSIHRKIWDEQWSTDKMFRPTKVHELMRSLRDNEKSATLIFSALIQKWILDNTEFGCKLKLQVKFYIHRQLVINQSDFAANPRWKSNNSIRIIQGIPICIDYRSSNKQTPRIRRDWETGTKMVKSHGNQNWADLRKRGKRCWCIARIG